MLGTKGEGCNSTDLKEKVKKKIAGYPINKYLELEEVLRVKISVW
jgi:hypothetical protein